MQIGDVQMKKRLNSEKENTIVNQNALTVLKYALERLEELITNSYSPTLFRGKPFTELDLTKWNESVTKEIKNITIYLRREARDILHERSFELLIHQYQLTIIELLDKVFYYEKEAHNLILCGAYHLILDRLTDLLSFITKTFSLYFNNDERVSELYLLLSKKELKDQLAELHIRLKEKYRDEEIIKIAFAPINRFITATAKDVTYRKLLYTKELFKQLEVFSDSIKTTNDDKELIEILFYMNLNSSEFISYLLNIIINSINALDKQVLKIEKLTFYLKDFKQMQEKPGFALHTNEASVKEQVTTWISEEIFYLETKNRLLSVMPALNNDLTISESEKLIVSVSVDVIALLARAGKDSKFILNKHMTGMFKNLSKFCRTVKIETPAANSMLKKSYVAERSNKLAAVNILHEMIKWIHKY